MPWIIVAYWANVQVVGVAVVRDQEKSTQTG